MDINQVRIDDNFSLQFEDSSMIKSEPIESEYNNDCVDLFSNDKSELVKHIELQNCEITKLKEKLKHSDAEKRKLHEKLYKYYLNEVKIRKTKSDKSTMFDFPQSIMLLWELCHRGKLRA